MLSDWKDALLDQSDNVFERITNFFPNLLGAVLILVIGWLVAVILQKIVDKALRLIGVQKLLELVKIEEVVKRGKFKIDSVGIISAFVKWIVLIVTFLAAADILNLPQVVDFFAVLLGFVPSVIAAAAIVLLGAVLAKFLGDVVRGSSQAGRLAYSNVLASVTVWAVWVFALLAALVQLGVAAELIRTLFTGFVALAAIAGGLAFGLGGQNAAKRLIAKLEKDLKSKKNGGEESVEEMEI